MTSLVRAAGRKFFITNGTPALLDRAGTSTITRRRTVTFIPLLEITRWKEHLGEKHLKTCLGRLQPVTIIVEHAGSMPGISNVGWGLWVHSRSGMNFSKFCEQRIFPLLPGIWEKQTSKDYFFNQVRWIKNGEIPQDAHEREKGLYEVLAQHEATVKAEENAGYDAWFGFASGFFALKNKAPEQLYEGKLEVVFQTMREASSKISDGVQQRDRVVAKQCQEEIETGQNVIMLRGIKHIPFLAPLLISKGISVELHEKFKPYLYVYSPIDLTIALEGQIPPAKEEEIFLRHIAYEILNPGLALFESEGVQRWELSDWQAFQEAILELDPALIRSFAIQNASSPKEAIRASFSFFRKELIHFMRRYNVALPYNLISRQVGQSALSRRNY